MDQLQPEYLKYNKINKKYIIDGHATCVTQKMCSNEEQL